MKFALVVMVIAAGTLGFCGARAQVFKCTAANGAVSFQDHACARGQRQTMIDVPSRAPPGYVPPPVATIINTPSANIPTNV